MRFTDRILAALPSPERGQRLYTDASIPGFGLRVGTRSKTFVLTIGASRHRVTLGRYPIISLAQARDKARTILAQRQLGLDKPQCPLFADVEEQYRGFRVQTLRPGTVRKDPSYFKIFAPLARLRLGDIELRDVQGLLASIDAISSRQETHNRFVGLIRFAQKRGYIENWPIHRLDYPSGDFARDRVLDNDELRSILITVRLWRRAAHPFGTIIRSRAHV